MVGKISFLRECPLCGEAYGDRGISIIEQGEETELVHITCTECHNAVLALVAMTQLGMTSVGVVTDLSDQDVRRFLPKRSFTVDDVIMFHEHLYGSSEFERELGKYIDTNTKTINQNT